MQSAGTACAAALLECVSIDVNQSPGVIAWRTSAVRSMWKGKTFKNWFSPLKSRIGRNPPSFFGIRPPHDNVIIIMTFFGNLNFGGPRQVLGALCEGGI